MKMLLSVMTNVLQQKKIQKNNHYLIIWTLRLWSFFKKKTLEKFDKKIVIITIDYLLSFFYCNIMKYNIWLIIVFVGFWIRSGINPSYPHDRLLENVLVLAFIPIVILLARYFRLSKLSYTMIAIFMILHIIGSHYTYSEVPFGTAITERANNMGWVIANLLWGTRNSYDRLVHLSFGLCFVYPVREIFLRMVRVKWLRWYALPIAIMWMLWWVYEIIERIVAANVSEAAWSAFLGSQGDIRDAQKDIFLAAIGWSLIMSIVFGVNAYFKKDFRKDMKETFHLIPRDHALGEEELTRYLQQ